MNMFLLCFPHTQYLNSIAWGLGISIFLFSKISYSGFLPQLLHIKILQTWIQLHASPPSICKRPQVHHLFLGDTLDFLSTLSLGNMRVMISPKLLSSFSTRNSSSLVSLVSLAYLTFTRSNFFFFHPILFPPTQVNHFFNLTLLTKYTLSTTTSTNHNIARVFLNKIPLLAILSFCSQ